MLKRSLRTFCAKLFRFKKCIFSLLRPIQTIHGLKHLHQPDRHLLEFLLWLSILVSISLSWLWCASTFWIRYFTNPTVITLARNYYDWNTTFPSLSFCRHEKLNRTAMKNYIEQVNPENVTELETFLEELVNFNYSNFEELDYPNISVNMYKELAFNLSNNVYYNVTANNLTYYLTKTMNDLGVCFSFNSEISKYFTYEYLLQDTLPDQNITHLVNYFDKDLGAVIVGMSESLDIYIHNPYDMPILSAMIETERQRQSYISLQFKPIIIESTESVKKLFISQRKCRFPHESNLKHFPDIYTHSLCKFECRIQLYLSYCSCLPFYIKAYGNERYCTAEDLKCLKFSRAFLNIQIERCECEQNCNELKYALQTKNEIFWFRGNFIRWELAKTRNRYKRDVIYSFTDALVDTGSNAGLFLGLSFISVIEIIFFICIHPCFRHRKKRL